MDALRIIRLSGRHAFLLLLAQGMLLVTFTAHGRPDLANLVFEPHPLNHTDAPLRRQDDAVRNFPGFDRLNPSIHVNVNDSVNAGVNPEQERGQEQFIAEQLAAVEATITREGPYSGAMEQELVKLAGLYQDAGDHQRALEAFRQAIQVNKIHHGLFHKDQVPLVEASIQSLLALGEYRQVDEELEYLIYLHQKFYGSDSTALIRPLATKVAWDMYYYESNALWEPSPVLEQKALANGFALAPQVPGTGLLTRTQELIIKGIQILVSARDFSNPFLHRFEQQLIETYFYQAYHDGQTRASSHYVSSLEGSSFSSEPFDLTKANFLNGEKAYQRLLEYMKRSGQENSLDYVVATIGLGDWYLLFAKLDDSRRQYEKAGLLLAQGNFSDADKAYLLQPAVPTELPAFGASPLFAGVGEAQEAPAGSWMGYADVSFEISRYGKAVHIQLLEHSPDAPKAVLSALEWKLKDGLFRPHFAGGTPAGSEPLRIRYYYRY